MISSVAWLYVLLSLFIGVLRIIHEMIKYNKASKANPQIHSFHYLLEEAIERGDISFSDKGGRSTYHANNNDGENSLQSAKVTHFLESHMQPLFYLIGFLLVTITWPVDFYRWAKKEN